MQDRLTRVEVLNDEADRTLRPCSRPAPPSTGPGAAATALTAVRGRPDTAALAGRAKDPFGRVGPTGPGAYPTSANAVR